MTELAIHLSTYLQQHLPCERNASRDTIESYASSWRLLVVFASERLDIRPHRIQVEQLTVHLILDFLDFLECQRGNGARTRNIRLAAIKSFFRYLEFRAPQYLELSRQVHAIPDKRYDQKLIDWLERQELQALIDAPDIKTASGVRDRAMILLAYSCGLRVSELLALTIDSIEQPGVDAVQVMGKGRRQRILPLWNETRTALVDWLNVRFATQERHLFLNARGLAMTRQGFAYLLAKHVKQAQKTQPSIAGKHVTAHVLRHTCAVHVLEATGDIRQVSLWLGHASMQTTEIYLRVNPAKKLEMLASQVPPAIQKGAFNGVEDKLIRLLSNPLAT